MARRLVESGVRFVEVLMGDGVAWDTHRDNFPRTKALSTEADIGMSALIDDLDQRGLLDSTLVIWGTEFGRTPVSENGKGRDHNPPAFTMWMAGGGVKGGQVIGQTDEIGFKTVGERYHPRDLHATILQLLGLDQMKLTYLHNGRNERLTDFGGRVIEQLIA